MNASRKTSAQNITYDIGATRVNLGARIRRLRTSQRLTQSRFASMVGIDRAYLIGIEKGERNPTVNSLAKIADGLDVTLAELFFDLEAEREQTALVANAKRVANR